MTIIKLLILPLFYSLFIYFEHLNISIAFLDTALALTAIFLFFILAKKELLISGFLIGLLWFWWLGYSFDYYGVGYLIPVALAGVGSIYGLLFYIGGLKDHLIYRGVYFFLLSFIEPFGFNWFKLELVFINSYIGITKLEFLIVLIATASFLYLKGIKKEKNGFILYSLLIIGLFFYNYPKENIEKNPLKIYLNETNIEQDQKWKREFKDKIVFDNLSSIDKAIKEKYDLIVFPETSFPIVLNSEYYKELKDYLYKKSENISIIFGALYEKDGFYYNSTYLFEKGDMRVAHKVVLVPFGEAVPLPQKLRDIINDTFYGGAKDYETAKEPTTFNIKGVKFRNAICYEATTDKIYENLDTQYVIATSNNAWFTPSIEPALQKLLLKYYAKKYNLVIYSVTNKSSSGIIRP